MVNTKKRMIDKSQGCSEQGEDDSEFFFPVSLGIFRHIHCVCLCVGVGRRFNSTYAILSHIPTYIMLITIYSLSFPFLFLIMDALIFFSIVLTAN